MQRLVFNPKAYAFINTQKHGIVDVSDYIIRGRVNRRINAASSAELTLQNPDMLFTDDGGIRMTPMDPITIYLQRKSGYPIRTFTGYLDKVPYYQLLPGPVEITATCTLKRLLHTYFDPALAYTQQFLQSYGWLEREGQLFSMTAQDDGTADGETPMVGGAGFQGAASTAAAISARNYAYSWGGGHAKVGTPGGPNNGFDCSGYVAAILAGAGWGIKKGQSFGSSMEFANWGKPGRGKEITVYYNSGHVYLVFEKGGPGGAKRADTSGINGGKNTKKGPHLRYGDRDNGPFQARHWPGH